MPAIGESSLISELGTHVLGALPQENLRPTRHRDLAPDLARGPSGQTYPKSYKQQSGTALGASEEQRLSLCHALRCPRSGDRLELGSIEEMISRPPLDLPGDA
jgi:hypothetical protein